MFHHWDSFVLWLWDARMCAVRECMARSEFVGLVQFRGHRRTPTQCMCIVHSQWLSDVMHKQVQVSAWFTASGF
jgi:hypothetical protein